MCENGGYLRFLTPSKIGAYNLLRVWVADYDSPCFQIEVKREWWVGRKNNGDTALLSVADGRRCEPPNSCWSCSVCMHSGDFWSTAVYTSIARSKGSRRRPYLRNYPANAWIVSSQMGTWDRFRQAGGLSRNRIFYFFLFFQIITA